MFGLSVNLSNISLGDSQRRIVVPQGKVARWLAEISEPKKRSKSELLLEKPCTYSWDWPHSNSAQIQPSLQIKAFYHLPKWQALFKNPDLNVN